MYSKCIGTFLSFALLSTAPLWAQDLEVAYAPREFKVSAPAKTTIEPVVITGFPVTAEGKESKYLVVVLIVRGPKQWMGSLTAENAVLTVRGGSKIAAEYLAFGAGGSFTFGPGSGPPYKLVFGKTGIVVGSGMNAVTLDPIFAFKMASVKYESTDIPAQFWFLFPFTESRTRIASIQLDTVRLDNTGAKAR